MFSVLKNIERKQEYEVADCIDLHVEIEPVAFDALAIASLPHSARLLLKPK